MMAAAVQGGVLVGEGRRGKGAERGRGYGGGGDGISDRGIMTDRGWQNWFRGAE